MLQPNKVTLRRAGAASTHLTLFVCPGSSKHNMYTNNTIIFTSRYYYFLFFWPCHRACRILVPHPGIEPMLPAMEVQNFNLWITREVLQILLFSSKKWESCIQLRQCCFRALNHYVTYNKTFHVNTPVVRGKFHGVCKVRLPTILDSQFRKWFSCQESKNTHTTPHWEHWSLQKIQIKAADGNTKTNSRVNE